MKPTPTKRAPNKVHVGAWIDKKLKAEIDRIAKALGISRSSALVLTLQEGIDSFKTRQTQGSTSLQKRLGTA